MTPSFAGLNGGLFSSVQKADVGDGAGRLIERGVDIMAWADPFFPDPSLPASVEHARQGRIKMHRTSLSALSSKTSTACLQ